MEAVLWINKRRCRVIVRDDASVIDTNDEWNNRASAESWAMHTYPTASIRFVPHHETDLISTLNREWNAYLNP